MSTFMLSAILQQVSNSSKYKAAWVYYALPIAQPGKVLSGMYKAIVTLYFLPYCIVLGTITVAIWGPEAINDVLLASTVSIIYGMLMALFMVKGLPFSRPVVAKQGGGKMVASFLILGFIAAIGYGHYLIMQWETVVWIAIIPAVILVWMMSYYYKRQTWDNIESVEM